MKIWKRFGKTTVHCRFLWKQLKFGKDLEALNFWKNANFWKKANGRAAIKIWKKKIQYVYRLGYGNARLFKLLRNMAET